MRFGNNDESGKQLIKPLPNLDQSLDFNQPDPDHTVSQKSRRMNFSASKTAGKIQMQGLRPDDIDKSEYIGRDAVTIIEGEFR